MSEPRNRPEPQEMKHTPGHRYETCVGCGLEWNVALDAPQGWYVCPRCAEKMRHEAKEAAKAAGGIHERR